MVEELIRGIAKWPDDDRRKIALALVRVLPLTDLAEVLSAAHTRIHKEADKRKARVPKAAR
jgi:hypothetical protein